MECFDPAWPQALLTSEPVITLFGHTRCHGGIWRIAERVLPDEHLIYVIQRGAMETRIAGQRQLIDASRCLWLSPGVRHEFCLPSDDDEMLVYHLRFRTRATVAPAVSCVPRSPEVEALIAELHRDERAPGLHHDLRQCCRLTLLLTELLRLRVEADRPAGLTPAQVRAVRELIERADPAVRFEPADLADAAGLAPAYFTRRFTPTFGCSPRTWLKRERLRRAGEVLAESTVAVGAIAEHFGYDELFRFSRQFREVMGCSPSAWRRRHAPPRSRR